MVLVIIDEVSEKIDTMISMVDKNGSFNCR